MIEEGSYAIQVITDQEATIPAANPPIFGQITVSAYAINQGTRGNIPSYDINQACCANAVLAKNTNSFTGGQDERNFQTFTKSDIDTTALPLKSTLAQSMQLFPCRPQVTSDHALGAEATHVKVTVSEICSAVAYNSQELAQKATDLLSHQAIHTVGAGYSLIGAVKVSITQATIPTAHTKPVILSFHAQGIWIYGLSHTEQQRIKSLITGKTKQEAARLLASLPGIEHASIRWGDETKLPKHTESIRVVVMYGI